MGLLSMNDLGELRGGPGGGITVSPGFIDDRVAQHGAKYVCEALESGLWNVGWTPIQASGSDIPPEPTYSRIMTRAARDKVCTQARREALIVSRSGDPTAEQQALALSQRQQNLLQSQAEITWSRGRASEISEDTGTRTTPREVRQRVEAGREIAARLQRRARELQDKARASRSIALAAQQQARALQQAAAPQPRFQPAPAPPVWTAPAPVLGRGWVTAPPPLQAAPQLTPIQQQVLGPGVYRAPATPAPRPAPAPQRSALYWLDRQDTGSRTPMQWIDPRTTGVTQIPTNAAQRAALQRSTRATPAQQQAALYLSAPGGAGIRF